MNDNPTHSYSQLPAIHSTVRPTQHGASDQAADRSLVASLRRITSQRHTGTTRRSDKDNLFCLTILLALVPLLWHTQAIGQHMVHHQSPAFVEPGELLSFEFRIPGIAPESVREAYFNFRYDGEQTFRQIRAEIHDHIVVAGITLDGYSGRTAEYYLSLEYRDGEMFHWPDPQTGRGPAAVEIISREQAPVLLSDSYSGRIEYSILSPQPDERMRQSDFFMGITLFYEFEEAIADSFVVFFDGINVTAQSEISPYLITYLPEEAPEPGAYSVQILYNSPDGSTLEIASWPFRLISATARPSEEEHFFVSGPPSGLITSGQYQATASSRVIAEQTSHLFRNNLRISGRQGSLRYTLSGLLTTEENPRLQPQNRFAGSLEAGEWFKFEAGHVYPSLNPYLIAGRRMQGVHSSLNLFSSNLQFQFISGQLSRRIPPIYAGLVREERILGQTSVGENIFETSYLLRSQPRGAGTYRRDIMGARVGFGNERPFGLAFSALRVRDDMHSVGVVRSFSDLPTEILSTLSAAEQLELRENPELLRLQTNDPRPQANLALATTLRINLDNNRFQLHGDAAASLINDDITEGVLDRNRADDLGFDLDDNITSLLDQLSWFIVINENMNALPFRFQDDQTVVFVPTGIFGGHSRLNLNYFNHNLSVQYQWVGPDFNTLANVGQRRDIAGYSITDRFRIFSNTLYLTLGHEALRDNVIGNRETTTYSTTNRVQLGWYPLSDRLPRITFGVRHRTRDNDLDRNNPFLPARLRGASVRNIRSLADSLIVLPAPRNNITMQYNASVSQRMQLFELSHDAEINYTYMTTNDRVFDYGDFVSHVLSFSLSSSGFGMPLQTVLGFNMNHTESASGLSSVIVYGFSGSFTWNFFQNRFQLGSEFALTLDTSETTPLTDTVYEGFSGRSNEELYWRYFIPDTAAIREELTASYLFGGNLRYRIASGHSLQLQGTYTHLADRHTGLSLPNNHMVQARYIFDF